MLHPSASDPFSGCQRQIHLDFHNSPHLADLLAEFDPRDLARRFRDANVNSVVVFAKCVHGMGYYPSKVVTPHPALGGRDLTGELIEALHAEGIRAPIYTILAWEESLAQTRPEWMQITRDGNFAQLDTASDNETPIPGRFRFLNFLHPEYQEYFAAHLDELLSRYPIDGLFIDMLVVHPKADWSETAIAWREKRGLLGEDPLTHARFEARAQAECAERFTRQIRASHPNAGIFYNSENRLFTDGSLGVRARAEHQTHFEIESLPTGFWGYHHFPRVARNLWREGKPWLSMTGRFQRMWGDFGGLKPLEALEFECFRAQALGGANSIGDQLHPRGVLDRGAIRHIGSVFADCAEAEPFYIGTEARPAIAIVCPHDPALPEHETTESEEGALMLCQEAHRDCAIVTDAADLSPFRLVILPDDVRLTTTLRAKLDDFHAAGGAILASARAGLPGTPGAEESCHAIPAHWVRPAKEFPNYWRARACFDPTWDDVDRVIYLRGVEVDPAPGAEILVDRVRPYFQRTDLHWCSHFQSPPRPETSGLAAVLAGERCVYFADPIFREYRRHGSQAIRDLWRRAITRLLGESDVDGLSSTVRAYPRFTTDGELRLTLLHYVAKRKGRLDLIEERSSFAGEALRLPSIYRHARIWPEGPELTRDADGRFVLPPTRGRLLLTAHA